jgi:hypothetical protein
MIKILMIAYAFPPVALEADIPLRGYAAAAITASTFAYHTSITLVE